MSQRKKQNRLRAVLCESLEPRKLLSATLGATATAAQLQDPASLDNSPLSQADPQVQTVAATEQELATTSPTTSADEEANNSVVNEDAGEDTSSDDPTESDTVDEGTSENTQTETATSETSSSEADADTASNENAASDSNSSDASDVKADPKPEQAEQFPNSVEANNSAGTQSASDNAAEPNDNKDSASEQPNVETNISSDSARERDIEKNQSDESTRGSKSRTDDSTSTTETIFLVGNNTDLPSDFDDAELPAFSSASPLPNARANVRQVSTELPPSNNEKLTTVEPSSDNNNDLTPSPVQPIEKSSNVQTPIDNRDIASRPKNITSETSDNKSDLREHGQNKKQDKLRKQSSRQGEKETPRQLRNTSGSSLETPGANKGKKTGWHKNGRRDAERGQNVELGRKNQPEPSRPESTQLSKPATAGVSSSQESSVDNKANQNAPTVSKLAANDNIERLSSETTPQFNTPRDTNEFAAFNSAIDLPKLTVPQDETKTVAANVAKAKRGQGKRAASRSDSADVDNTPDATVQISKREGRVMESSPSFTTKDPQAPKNEMLAKQVVAAVADKVSEALIQASEIVESIKNFKNSGINISLSTDSAGGANQTGDSRPVSETGQKAFVLIDENAGDTVGLFSFELREVSATPDGFESRVDNSSANSVEALNPIGARQPNVDSVRIVKDAQEATQTSVKEQVSNALKSSGNLLPKDIGRVNDALPEKTQETRVSALENHEIPPISLLPATELADSEPADSELTEETSPRTSLQQAQATREPVPDAGEAAQQPTSTLRSNGLLANSPMDLRLATSASNSNTKSLHSSSNSRAITTHQASEQPIAPTKPVSVFELRASYVNASASTQNIAPHTNAWNSLEPAHSATYLINVQNAPAEAGTRSENSASQENEHKEASPKQSSIDATNSDDRSGDAPIVKTSAAVASFIFGSLSQNNFSTVRITRSIKEKHS